MKKFIWVLLIVFSIAVAPLHLGNAYLQSSDFTSVTVQKNENITSIASRYANDPKEVKKLAEAIKEINSLDNDSAIRTGQNIKIPLLHKLPPTQLAAK